MTTTTPTPAPVMRNGLGIASFVLGVVGSVLGLAPIGCFIAIICGIVGLVLGFSGRKRIDHGQADNPKMAAAGVLTSFLALVLGIIGIVIMVSTMNKVSHDINDINKQLNQTQQQLQRDLNSIPTTLPTDYPTYNYTQPTP